MNVLPGTLGTQYFCIQDDTGGIQIYSSKKLFPDLAIGDVVQIHGTVSSVNGEVKVNTSLPEDILILSHNATLTAQVVTAIASINYGKLVQVTGVVASKSGSTITLDNGFTIYIKRNSEISTSSFTTGPNVTITGVMIANDDGINIMPRNHSIKFGSTS